MKTTNDIAGDPSLLIVEDNEIFRGRLARAMARRGFEPMEAETVETATAMARSRRPRFAVVDFRLKDGHGLTVIEALRAVRPDARCVVLTGYDSIATAVAAVKSGANDYLAKPADAEEIVAALMAEAPAIPPVPENPISADRIKWEHIHRVHALCGWNVSETARRLGMHRRSLQRVLAKRAPI